MSAPMVTGAVALLLARHPGLTPDQVKQLLVSTATGYPGQPDTAGELNIVAALLGNIPPVAAQQTLHPIGGTPPPADKVTLLWDGTHWASTYWDGSRWEASHWNASHWDASHWDASHWDASHWDASHWDGSANDD